MCRAGQFWIPLSKNLSSHCKNKNLNWKANMHLDSKRCMSFTMLENTQSSAKIKLCGSAMVTDTNATALLYSRWEAVPFPCWLTPEEPHEQCSMETQVCQESTSRARELSKENTSGLEAFCSLLNLSHCSQELKGGDNLRKIKEGIRYLEGFDKRTNVCTGHS